MEPTTHRGEPLRPLTNASEKDGLRATSPAAFRLPSRRDARMGYGQGWVLVAGMVCLATVFLGIVWNAAPRAARGWIVALGAIAAILFLLAPAAAVFTRRLYKRERARKKNP